MYPMYFQLDIKFFSLGLRICRIGCRDLGIVVTRTQEPTICFPPSSVSGSWMTPESNWKIIKFQAIPQGNKSHEKWTLRPPQITKKSIWVSREIQFLRTSFFAILPMPNEWCSNPRHANFDTKTIRKISIETIMNKHTFLVQATQQN